MPALYAGNRKDGKMRKGLRYLLTVLFCLSIAVLLPLAGAAGDDEPTNVPDRVDKNRQACEELLIKQSEMAWK